MQKTFLAVFSLVTATFFYSFFAVLTRILGFDLPIFFSFFFINFLGALLLLLPLCLTGKFIPMTKTDWQWLIWRTVGGTISFFGSYYAFYYLPMGITYFVFYGGSTVFGFILGALLFNEKVSRLEIISLLISLLGLLLLHSIGEMNQMIYLYLVWAFIGGAGAAIWNTFSKKISLRYSASQLNGLDFALCAAAMILFSIIARESWVMPSLSLPWLANLLFVVIFVVAGQSVIFGFKYLDVQKASLIMLLEVVFGTIIGWLVYHENLNATSLLGGTLILLGVALPQIYKKS